MYLVEVAGGGSGSRDDASWVLVNLRAWYSFRKMGGLGGRMYYAVGDDASLELFREALEAFGFKVTRVEKLEGGPWYIAGYARAVAEDAMSKALAREAFSLLREAGWPAQKTVREVAARVAEERGLNPDKVYRTFLYALEKLSGSVMVDAMAHGIDGKTLGRLAVRVGLVPLKLDERPGGTFHSGRYLHDETEHDGLLRALGGMKLGPAALAKALKSLVEREHGTNARYVLRTLTHSKAYQVLLARAKAAELERLVRETKPGAGIAWRLIIVNLEPSTLKGARATARGASLEAGREGSRSYGLPAP